MIFLVLQLIKYGVVADYGQSYGEKRIEIALDKSSGITYQAMRAADEYSLYHPVLQNHIRDISTDTNKKVEVIGTTSLYEQLERLHMVDGAFFGEEAVKEGRDIVVISDQLSMDLVGACKGVGNLIHIGEKAYIIVGVYKKYERIRDYMMDDGYEKVYVPITASVVQKNSIEFCTFDGTYLEQMPSIEELQRMGLGEQAGIKSNQETWVKECRSIGQLPMVCLWVLFTYLGASMLYKRTVQNYIRGKLLFEALIYFVGVLILFKLTFDLVCIRPDSLPRENIFDLTFYWKALRKEWIRHNQFVQIGISQFDKALYLLKWQLHSINFIQYLCLFKGTSLMVSCYKK